MSQTAAIRVGYDAIRGLDSPEKLLRLLRSLGFASGSFFDEPIRLTADKMEYWGFEMEGIKDVYPLFVLDEFRIFLVEVKGELSKALITQTVKRMESKGYGSYYAVIFADEGYARIALTTWLKISSRLDIENLIIDRKAPVRSDLAAFDDLEELLGSSKTYQDYQRAFYEALSKEKLTQRFFEDFTRAVDLVELKVKGISDEKDRRRFALLILTRIMFLYFLQKKGWLGGDRNFMANKLNSFKDENVNFYEEFLQPLFFEVMNTEPINRSKRARTIGGDQLTVKIPYLNGGLFETSPIERRYSPTFPKNSKEGNQIFSQIIIDFFEQYRFTLREDLPESKEVGIDPELMGKVFEEFIIARERKAEGAYYTPKEVVEFMSRYSLYAYLANTLDRIDRVKLEDAVFRNQASSLTPDERRELNRVLHGVRVLDPAVGSGAFLYGIMVELQRLRGLSGESMSSYEFRRDIISRNIYGVDIEPSTIWMAELRLWLSLIEEMESIPMTKVPALPNLDHRLKIGNSLIDRWEGIDFSPPQNQRLFPRKEDDSLAELQTLKEKAFEASSEEKQKIERTINALEMKLFLGSIEEKIRLGNRAEELRRLIKLKKELEIADSPPIFLWYLHFREVFEQGGFDIVIMNPPYVNTKLVSKLDYNGELEDQYGFVDDLYNHFAHRAFKLTKPGGVVTMITSDTYFYLESKQNMRELLQSKSLLLLMPTMKVFRQMVDTAILTSVNRNHVQDDHSLFVTVRSADEAVFTLLGPVEEMKEEIQFSYGPDAYLTECTSLPEHPDVTLYRVPIDIYRRSIRKIFFEPNKIAAEVYNRFMQLIVELDKSWGNKIQDSKTITKYRWQIERHHTEIGPESVTLLGLITEGAVGLQTGDNGKYVALLEGSIEAEQVQAKLEGLRKEWGDNEKIRRAYQAARRTNGKLEEIIDSLRKKFSDSELGTHGMIYRVIKEDDVADIDALLRGKDSERLRLNLINQGLPEGKPHWVPYDKGDKEGNRWFHESPYFINWSRKSVEALQNSSEARWQGYDYFFLEGFSWTDVNTDLIKCRLIPNCVNDVKSMKLTSKYSGVSDKYLCAILNSQSLFKIKQIISPGNTFQIGHARIMPVVIPTNEEKEEIERLVTEAVKAQAKFLKAGDESRRNEWAGRLAKFQDQIDTIVRGIYGV